jgi:hypothetical protein
LIIFVIRKELLGPQPLPGEEAVEAPSHGHSFIRRVKTIDVGAQLLFLFGFGSLILAFTWAGATYAWNSAAVLTPLCVGTVLIVAFIYWESMMVPGGSLARRWPNQQPMIPWKLLAHRDTGLMFYITFATGAAMYSVSSHASLHFHRWISNH